MSKITVFTPTYNRAYIINNLYQSLKRQTYQDFEWVVIDDGSTDETESLFSRFQNDDKKFNIKYKKVENAGKHRAINKGLSMAEGELFYIVDSDDYLTDDALETIMKTEKTIPKNEKHCFAGVCGLKAYSTSIYVGSTFHGAEYLDITSLQRDENQISGDKAEVFYTEILRKYPFPEFDGEKFLSECIVWDRIAKDGYKLRFFNKIVYICDYLQDGLSTNCSIHFQNSPKGYALLITQSIEYGKAKGLKKWEMRRDYYNQFVGRIKTSQIAKNLKMSRFMLHTKFFIMRLFYIIYR